MPGPEDRRADVPEARAVSRRRTHPSVVWIVPLIAALAGVWVAVTRIMSQGPTITIVLDSAEGLEAGKTKIHYNGVDVGSITTIRLSDDHQSVVATAKMEPDTEDFLVEGTKFWVVRPRISGANVSGLGTLISGSYLGMEIGSSGKKQRDFIALQAPPVVTGDVPGTFFVLKASELGSLDYGTPIYFRRLQVGEVVSYALDADGQTLTIRVFVRAPYDKYVQPDTRFFQASGIDVSLSASGLTVQTQSVLSILVGGIAFETPTPGQPAAAESVYRLFDDRTRAFQPAARDPQTYVLVFRESVRGLAVGAPVEFRGIKIGEVTHVRVELDAQNAEITAPVTVVVDPRLGVDVVDAGPPSQEFRDRMLPTLVARGFRAQLRSGNLLTGATYVALDVFPDAPPATIDMSRKPIEVPTVPGTLDGIESSIARIVKKLDGLPWERIGAGLDKAVVNLDGTLTSARGALDDARHLLGSQSGLGDQLGATLGEVSRAARALRVLADYLEQHPESLLRGKDGGGK
jgi:paraquat-inducible protein B